VRRKSAENPIDRAEIVILFLSSDTPLMASDSQSDDPVLRFIVANLVRLCHKRSLHRPADQGLPWRCFCGLFRLRDSRAFSTL
jgi:hypothetical protein